MWSSYSPQSIGILLYLLCFMLLITPRNTAAEYLLIILTFSVLLITHGMAALAVLLSLVILSIYRRQLKFILLFLVLFSSWYMFQAVAIFEQGVASWWSAPLRQIFQMFQQVESAGGVAPAERLILRSS